MKENHREKQQLALVSRLHMIFGVLGIFWSLVLCIGTFIGRGRAQEPSDVRLVIDIISGIGLLGSLLLSAGLVAVAVAVRRRKHHAFCVVLSGLLCFCFPFGTMIGMFSIYVLNGGNVKTLFENQQE